LVALARQYGVEQSRFAKPEFQKAQGRFLAGHRRRSQRLHPVRPLRPAPATEIRDNQVHQPGLQGYKAQIAFDLNTPMGKSTCVACGECMVSCPTSALTFRESVKPDMQTLVQGQFAG